MRSLRLFLLRLLVLMFAANAGAQRYHLITIDFPGAGCTVATGINSAGQIVGTYSIDSSCLDDHGFVLYKKGHFLGIDFPRSSSTTAQGVNPNMVVGVYSLGGHDFGYSVDNRRDFTTVDFAGASGTEALGINIVGQIVGSYSLTGQGSNNSFLFSGGSFTTIDPPGSAPPNGSSEAFGINSSGVVVGVYGVAGPFTENQGYSLAGGVYTTINVPGASLTRAVGINDSGQIVGDYQDSKGFHGYLLDSNGTFTTLDVPGAASTHAYGINDNGLIVGQYTDSTGNTHGALAIPRHFSINCHGTHEVQ